MVTLAAKGGQIIVQRPKGVSLITLYTNDTTIQPGVFVTCNGDSTPDCNRVDAGAEVPLGIAVERRDGTAQDPDTIIPDGTPLTIAPCGSGIVAYAIALTSRGALVPGDFLMMSGLKGTIKGSVAAKITMTTITVALRGALWQNVGRTIEYDADVADWDYVKVRLCH